MKGGEYPKIECSVDIPEYDMIFPEVIQQFTYKVSGSEILKKKNKKKCSAWSQIVNASSLGVKN